MLKSSLEALVVYVVCASILLVCVVFQALQETPDPVRLSICVVLLCISTSLAVLIYRKLSLALAAPAKVTAP